MRMLQSCGELNLPPESVGAEARGELRRQHFDDHLPAEGGLQGDEDTRHPAAAELPLDGVRRAQGSLERFSKIQAHEFRSGEC